VEEEKLIDWDLNLKYIYISVGNVHWQPQNYCEVFNSPVISFKIFQLDLLFLGNYTGQNCQIAALFVV